MNELWELPPYQEMERRRTFKRRADEEARADIIVTSESSELFQEYCSGQTYNTAAGQVKGKR